MTVPMSEVSPVLQGIVTMMFDEFGPQGVTDYVERRWLEIRSEVETIGDTDAPQVAAQADVFGTCPIKQEVVFDPDTLMYEPGPDTPVVDIDPSCPGCGSPEGNEHGVVCPEVRATAQVQVPVLCEMPGAHCQNEGSHVVIGLLPEDGIDGKLVVCKDHIEAAVPAILLPYEDPNPEPDYGLRKHAPGTVLTDEPECGFKGCTIDDPPGTGHVHSLYESFMNDDEALDRLLAAVMAHPKTLGCDSEAEDDDCDQEARFTVNIWEQEINSRTGEFDGGRVIHELRSCPKHTNWFVSYYTGDVQTVEFERIKATDPSIPQYDYTKHCGACWNIGNGPTPATRRITGSDLLETMGESLFVCNEHAKTALDRLDIAYDRVTSVRLG